MILGDPEMVGTCAWFAVVVGGRENDVGSDIENSYLITLHKTMTRETKMFAFTFIPRISHGSTLSLTNAQDNGCQARKMTTMGLYLEVAGTASISPLLGRFSMCPPQF